MTPNPTCLITGANGSNGTELLKLFAAQQMPVRAMVRDVGRAAALSSPTTQIVAGDFDVPATLSAALDGIECAFLLTPSSERAQEQQLAFVEAAKTSGVRHIVKLSQLHADADSPVRFLRYHPHVEAAIRASGRTWTFLRPNLFMQGLLAFVPTIQANSAFYAPASDAQVSLVDVRDIAQAAFAALTQSGHENKIYDLTGPEALTHGEVATQFSQVLGRQINFVDVAPEAMLEVLLGMKMPLWQAQGLVEDYAHYRRGEAAGIEPGVQEASGQAPRPFETFARDYADAFT